MSGTVFFPIRPECPPLGFSAPPLCSTAEGSRERCGDREECQVGPFPPRAAVSSVARLGSLVPLCGHIKATTSVPFATYPQSACGEWGGGNHHLPWVREAKLTQRISPGWGRLEEARGYYGVRKGEGGLCMESRDRHWQWSGNWSLIASEKRGEAGKNLVSLNS